MNETTSTEQTVIVKVSGRTAVIELNRPKAMNAMNEAMLQDLARSMKEVALNNEIDIVILKGNGKVFSAGGDINMMVAEDSAERFDSIMECISEIVTAFYFMPKLTISAIHGAAAGLGLSVALAADYLIADPDSKIAMNFIGIGLIPDGGGHFFLERRLGEAAAKELIWEGKVLSAAEAYEKHLIHEVAPDLEQAVEEKCQRWLASPVQAMVKTKKILSEKNRPLLLKMLELEKAGQLKMRQTADHQEGVRAFLEKRKPAFIGK